jgi:hypothetical protein
MNRSLLLCFLVIGLSLLSACDVEVESESELKSKPAPAEPNERPSQQGSSEVEHTTSAETPSPHSGLSAAEVLALEDTHEFDGSSNPLDEALGKNPVFRQPDYEASQQNPYNVTPDSQAVAAGYMATAMGGSKEDVRAAIEASREASIQPDPLTSAKLCGDLILGCVAESVSPSECFSSVRACRTDTPWKSETKPCCHRSCPQVYRKLVAGGTAELSALRLSIFGDSQGRGACMPQLRRKNN